MFRVPIAIGNTCFRMLLNLTNVSWKYLYVGQQMMFVFKPEYIFRIVILYYTSEYLRDNDSIKPTKNNLNLYDRKLLAGRRTDLQYQYMHSVSV